MKRIVCNGEVISGSCWEDVLKVVAGKNVGCKLKLEGYRCFSDYCVSIQQSFLFKLISSDKPFFFSGDDIVFPVVDEFEPLSLEGVVRREKLMPNYLINILTYPTEQVDFSSSLLSKRKRSIEQSSGKLQPAELIEVQIAPFGKLPFTLQLYTTDSIHKLKQEIKQRVGIALDSQRLVFGDKLLQDHSLLRDNNITYGSSLHLVVNLQDQRMNLSGIHETDGSFAYTYMNLNGTKVIIHPHWTTKETITLFQQATQSPNPSQYLQTAFQQTALRLYSQAIASKQAQLNLIQSQISRATQAFSVYE